MCIYVNNIPHGHALVRRIMVQACDMWYAVRTVEHVIYDTCDHFGFEYMTTSDLCVEPNTLVPDSLRERKPAGRSWMCFMPNLNG